MYSTEDSVERMAFPRRQQSWWSQRNCDSTCNFLQVTGTRGDGTVAANVRMDREGSRTKQPTPLRRQIEQMSIEPVVLFAGPRGAGKSTAIASTSDTPVVTIPIESDERHCRLDDAITFGRVALCEGEIIRLCGVPDRNIDGVRSAFGTRAAGLVLLIDDCARDADVVLERFLDRYGDLCRNGAAVVGITRTDVSAAAGNLRRYHRCVDRWQHAIPVYEVDARDRVQMLILLAALIEMLRLRITESGAE